MAKVVIFGLAENASLAHFYLTHDSQHEVVGFTVDREYLPSESTFEGLPVVPFEEIADSFPPTSVSLFAPLSPRDMNQVRARVYQAAKERGYSLISYVSSKATVFSNVTVGDNCFILEDNTLQPFVRIGNNVILWSGNHIGHHGEIKDHVFFTSHVVLSGRCTVEPYCFFGVNATIRDGLRIAEGSFIGMGACVMRNTHAWGVYTGNPATKGKKPSADRER